MDFNSHMKNTAYLDKRAPMVAAALLPLRSTALRNGVDGLVAPAGTGRTLWAWHRAFARRNRQQSPAHCDCLMAAFRVVCADISDILMRHQRSA